MESLTNINGKSLQELPESTNTELEIQQDITEEPERCAE
jgi:hypothetical protein